MRIMTIDAEYVGICCSKEFMDIIYSIDVHLSLHDEEYQNQFMSKEKPHEFKFKNGAKLLVGRKTTTTCYLTYCKDGEELFTETFGFNKGREYAHGFQNIEISLSKTLKYGKYGVFIRAKKEKAAMVHGQIEYLHKKFGRMLYLDYIKSVEKPVKFEHTPTLITELKLNKRIEEKIGYVKGSTERIPRTIKELLGHLDEVVCYNSCAEMELIYRIHDAGINFDDPDFDSRDERKCYDYIDEEDERVGRHASHTFDYNMDIKTRDEIIYGAYEPDKYNGGIRYYKGMTSETLRKLIDMKFADPDDIQNHAPSLNAFMNFIGSHEGYTVGGYTIDDTRDDYRVTIDSIALSKKAKEHDQITFAGFVDCVKRWYRDPQNETWHSPASEDVALGTAWWD